MRKINKVAGSEPQSLSNWKRRHPQGNYLDLSETERQDIRSQCAQDQYYLCAYCCKQISGTNFDTVNEHVEARRLAPNRSLDFTNIVASCATRHQCDDAHKSQPLPLTPFMEECETELEFTLSGKVRGLTQQAIDSIQVLNLGDELKSNRSLIEQRKVAIQTVLFTEGIDHEVEDDELIKMLIDDLSTPKDGKLEPYSPVVVNVLKQWLS